ncbi:MAG TPA: tetratricopeptide repeat protein [Thermoanaerobaculia bacterium]|nr:tetratricopeptide repeat protein [Thermoanaerobaculia bacterium]
MTDGVFPDRLTQLRARWESDPASRIFLQLAEEYRHLGRVQDALAVLDKGLKEHPGYLSALVAKGRCHLELGEGEEARVVLERVVKQDATQMVANKLLVRAYLDTSDPVKARERLDLYSLLNDSDPDIEDLRRRIRQMEKPASPERPSMDADPFAPNPSSAGPDDSTVPLLRSVMAPARPAEVFDLTPPAPPRRGGDDIFELAPPPRPAAAPALAATDFKSDDFPLEAAAPPPAPVFEPEEEPGDADQLFPGLSSRDSRRRYLDALSAEGLFAFEPLRAPEPFAPPPPISLTAEPFAPGPGPVDLFAPEPFAPEPLVEPDAPPAEEASWLDEAVAAAPPVSPAPPPEPLMPPIFAQEPPVPIFDLDATTADELWSEEAAPVDLAPPPVFEPEPVELEPAVPEPPVPVFEPAPEPEVEVVAEAEPEVATATLGELYLRQGHYAEAERIFREVLQREPASASARAGLDRLASLGPQPETPRLDARRLLAGYRRDPSRPADVEVRSRKTWVLTRYLDRLRQGRRPSDVS